MSRQFDYEGRALTVFSGREEPKIEIHGDDGKFCAMPLAVFVRLVARASWADNQFGCELQSASMELATPVRPTPRANFLPSERIPEMARSRIRYLEEIYAKLELWQQLRAALNGPPKR